MKIKERIKVVLSAAVVITSLLLSTSVHAATPVGQWLDGSYATGFCSYNSTDCSGTTGYIANRTKTVKVYAYASYGANYFCYGSSSGSAYGSTVASAYVGVASPYTAIGTKADHTAVGTSHVWNDTSSIGYTE